MASRDQYRLLAAQGLFGAALRDMRQTIDVDRASLEDAVLHCELLQATGRWREAHAKARALQDTSASRPDLIARLHIVLAQVCRDQCDASGTFAHLHAGQQAADAGGCLVESAWCKVRYLTSLATFRDIGTSMAALAGVRLAVRRAADPAATIALHLTVAEIDTRSGALGSALRHLEIAETLLNDFPKKSLQLRGCVARTCLHYVERNMTAALRSGEEALALALETEHQVPHAATLVNLAHVHCEMGHLSEADQSFRNALAIVKSLRAYRPAVLDGMAQVALLSGDLDQCESLLGQFDDAIDGLDRVYYHRSVVETKARLMCERGRWLEAHDLLVESIRQPALQQDVALFTRLVLILSRCSVELGNHGDACRLALAAATAAIDYGRCGIADVLRVLARGLADSDPAGARLLYSRVLQRYDEFGNRVAAAQVSQEMSSAQDCGGTEPAPETEFSTLQNAVELISAGDQPDLLARETARFAEHVGAGTPAVGPPLETSTVDVSDRLWNRGARFDIARFRTGIGMIAVSTTAPGDYRGTTNLLAVRELSVTAADAARARTADRERVALWPAESVEGWTTGVYASDAMKELLRVAERIASTPVTVMITGETGTGKEVLAKTIHDISDRHLKPFTAFNCAAVPRDIMESQLFGFKKGSFTGALDNSLGIIRGAQGGTLLLDEVGEIHPELQPKLLRFLESNEVHPIGEARPQQVDIRVIAATNTDIERLVSEGRFREDLYYRLNVIRLHVPPLRDRREDVPVFVQHFLERFTRQYRKAPVSVSDETLEYLLLYSWPGNVRQLANEIRRIVALATPGTPAGPELLSPEILQSRRTIPVAPPPAVPHEIAVLLDQPMESAIETLERAMIQHALRKTNGHLEEAARQLGVSRKGLYLKRLRFGFDSPGSQSPGNTPAPT